MAVDIEQLLPQDVYDAAVGANGPTALNPFATISDLIADDQTLAEVLTQGNSTNDGQKIVAATGNSAIDLRSWATNGSITISNDAAGKVGNSDYSLGWWEMAPTYSSLGFNTVALSMGAGSGQLTTNYNNNTDLSRLTMQSGAMFFQIIDNSTGRTALIGSTNNTASSPLTANIANMPSYISAQNCTIAQDVINSVGLGGVGLDVDKNNYVFVPNIEVQSGGIIDSSSGGSFIDLRRGADDTLRIATNTTAAAVPYSFMEFSPSGYLMQSGGTGIGTHYVNRNNVVGVNIAECETSIFNNPFSKWGRYGMKQNDSGSYNNFNFASYPFYAAAQNVTINQNVINSAAIGMNGGVIKTNNTLYTNQFGFNAGAAFETILSHTIPTADRARVLPDASGTVALNTGQVWTAPTNVSIDRTLNADSTTLDEVADVLGTLITDLRTGNILS
jgi:hypothetical protein